MSSPHAKSADDTTDSITLPLEQLELSDSARSDVTRNKGTPITSLEHNSASDTSKKIRVYSKDELTDLQASGVHKPKELDDSAPALMLKAKELDDLKPATKLMALGVYKTKGLDEAPRNLTPEAKDTVELQPEKVLIESTQIENMDDQAEQEGTPEMQPSKQVVFDEGQGPDTDPDDVVENKPAPEQPKKKKKKSKSKRKQNKPTGFEEYHTDPPVTPQEYKEESEELYHPARSFAERIELCIQRYRQKRNLDEVRAFVYTKYLALGGIDTGAKVGTGRLGKEDFENADAQQIAAYTATDKINAIQNTKYYNPVDKDSWVVDFTSIVKGFLSYKAPLLFRSSDPDEIKNWTMVVRNFLNYVLLHNVCPEYIDDVLEARRICNIADDEHPRISLIGPSLPGDFNVACSTMFGGYYKGLYGNSSAEFVNLDDISVAGMTEVEAERIVMTGLAMTGSQNQYTAAAKGKNNIKLLKSEFRSMEVIDIISATEETLSAYKAVKNTHGETGKLRPLGILKLRHWDNPSALEEDLTDAEIADPSQRVFYPDTEIWLENHILEACFIGMKFQAMFHELNIGLTYFDSSTGLHCSFFTYLENERMDGWKEPKINERPPPMVGEDVDIDGPVDDDFE